MAENEIERINRIMSNSSKRTIIMILIDTSLSMSICENGEKKSRIQIVNEVIPSFLKSMSDDMRTKDSLAIAVVTFGQSAKLLVDFESPDVAEKQIQQIEASDVETNLGAGAELAYNKLHEYLKILNAGGIEYYRPIMIIITDGEATDQAKVDAIAPKIRNDYHMRVKCFNVSAKRKEDVTCLQKFVISDNDIQNINSIDIATYFEWLSRSVTTASRRAVETSI